MAIMLFEWVFTSAFLILVVLALRAALGKRMSAGLRYGLWAVVLVRLLVPVQLFTSPIVGTWVVTEKRTERTVDNVEKFHNPNEDDILDSLGGQAGPSVSLTAFPQAPSVPNMPGAPEPPAPPDLTRAPAWLGWAWLAGSGLAALVLLASNLRFYRRLRRERVPLEEADLPLRVFAAAGLPSPCLFGILRPAVYVTPDAAADPDMLRHVLAHEYTHYRHGDHVWSLLRCAALAVHWWNPLVWLAAVLSQRDGELACDEGALKRLGDRERAAYGSTLLALVTAKPRPGDLFRCATTMAGDKKSLKERVSRIARAPKRVVWAVVVAVAVTALASLCAFGQAEPAEPLDSVDELNPTYTMNGDRNVLIEGVGGVYAEWSRGTNGGALYLAGDMSYFSPKLEGEKVEGGAYWDDVGNDKFQSVLHVRLNVDDDRIEDGTVNGFGIDFTVDLSNDTFTRKLFTSELGDRTIELTDQEMLDMVHILAKLLTEAADYYNSHAAGDPADLRTHFPADVENVPSEVLKAIAQDVEGGYENFLLCLDYQPIAVENNGLPEFDDWRVKTLDGPWTTTALGMNVEIWRGFSEYHTPEPEKAKYMLAGGMYVTEDGWFSPEDRMKYYIFELDQEGGRSLATIMIMGAGGGAPDGETQQMRDNFDAMVERTLADTRAVDPSGLSPDLNRNGVPEELRVSGVPQGMKLEVWENGKLLYEEEGYFAHAGYNALFLYRGEDGGDYLLRYNPYMAQGWGTYSYRLFRLDQSGGTGTAIFENLEFDLNFHPMMRSEHKFDVNEITRFMNEVNELLSHSVQLLNTDQDLLDTFERNGRLYDDLGWLDQWEPTYVRGEKALPDELWRFQSAMEQEWYEEEPVLTQVNETDVPAVFDLRYQDRSTRFTVDCADPRFVPTLQVLDWNGDGKDEIVFFLVSGSGTGVLVEDLYVFDADTLEQYDTSGVSEMIFNAIKSTGDEENFYLRGAGMDETVPKSGAREENEHAPVADALWFREQVRWTVKDGQVFCWLGCDASGTLTNYIGWVKVPVNMSPSGAFSCGRALYADLADGPE